MFLRIFTNRTFIARINILQQKKLSIHTYCRLGLTWLKKTACESCIHSTRRLHSISYSFITPHNSSHKKGQKPDHKAVQKSKVSRPDTKRKKVGLSQTVGDRPCTVATGPIVASRGTPLPTNGKPAEGTQPKNALNTRQQFSHKELPFTTKIFRP